ncbi:MAG: Gfo/Idh/MocA family oxidoreductase [Proteobacteria bacterium]|nr:Gfo/Idh/MocA family oxidoreductase [Pseudomonadota bacterium]
MPASIGFIGCGHIGRFHARNVRDAIARCGFDATYDAVCDLRIDRARQFADIAGCRLITSRAEEVIDACDIVYICTETAEHPALAVQALQAGCHVFCEKPLAKNLKDAQTMAAAAAASQMTHQAGLVLHFSPVYTVLKDLMSGDWGPLLSVHMRDDQSFPTGGQYGSSWRADPERAGSGALLEHSIHDVDLFTRLFGEVLQVQCETRETSGHAGIEDVAHVRFTHAGGHTSSLASIWHNIPTRQSGRSLEVFFERVRFTTEHDYFGTITMEIGDQPAVTLSADEVLDRYMDLQDLRPEEEDLRSIAGLGDRRFLEAALQGKATTPSFADALQAHEIVDACYRSAAAGTVIGI